MKMKHIILSAIIFASTICCYAQQARLLQPGQYHDEEVDENITGLTWFGLFEKDNQFYLDKTHIDIMKVHDPISDEDTTITSGDMVIVKNNDRCLFLVNDAPGIQPGKIKNIVVEMFFLKPGESWAFDFGMYHYILSATGAEPDTSSGWYNGEYNLFLEETNLLKQKQLIASDTLGSETPFTFYWMGDLNDDGQPDFLIDISWHYNLSLPTLFLSPGEKNGLVRQVAQLSRTGC